LKLNPLLERLIFIKQLGYSRT